MANTPDHCLLNRITRGCIAFTLALVALQGCKAAHPDEKAGVLKSLGSRGLSAVNVEQDRDEGLITLSGSVSSAAVRAQAEEAANQAAPDYTVANEIRVVALGTAAPPVSSFSKSVASNSAPVQ